VGTHKMENLTIHATFFVRFPALFVDTFSPLGLWFWFSVAGPIFLGLFRIVRSGATVYVYQALSDFSVWPCWW